MGMGMGMGIGIDSTAEKCVSGDDFYSVSDYVFFFAHRTLRFLPRAMVVG